MQIVTVKTYANIPILLSPLQAIASVMTYLTAIINENSSYKWWVADLDDAKHATCR